MKDKDTRSTIILCGGMSRRMGEDKGSIKIDEKPMIIYLLEALNSKIDEVIIVLNDEIRITKYKSLINDYINHANTNTNISSNTNSNADSDTNYKSNSNNNNLDIKNNHEIHENFDFKIKFVEDDIKNKGPLSGIMTGLKTISSRYGLVLPCDSPYIGFKFIDYMFNTLNDFLSSEIDIEGIIPYHRFNNNENNKKELLNNSEPLHSIYKKENYFIIKDLLKSDKKEVKSLIDIINPQFIPIDDNNSSKSSEINKINFKNINYKKDL